MNIAEKIEERENKEQSGDINIRRGKQKKRNIAGKREREENRGTNWRQWSTAGKRGI
jgi:hypothetical protein